MACKQQRKSMGFGVEDCAGRSTVLWLVISEGGFAAGADTDQLQADSRWRALSGRWFLLPMHARTGVALSVAVIGSLYLAGAVPPPLLRHLGGRCRPGASRIALCCGPSGTLKRSLVVPRSSPLTPTLASFFLAREEPAARRGLCPHLLGDGAGRPLRRY